MPPTTPNELDKFFDRYERNSRLFVREVLNVEPELWQDDLLQQYDLGTRRISVRSGHGVGKSTVLAWIMIHHLLFRFPQKTVVTAPTSAQLWDALWAEFKSWLSKLPENLLAQVDIKQERVELKAAPTESFTTARTSRAEQPEALQGIHSTHVLLIADEASGVPEQVFEAAGGSMSGHSAITVLTGNPVRGQGYFFDTHTKLAGTWWIRKVSCLESRFVSKEFIEDMRRRYGENSNAYRVRVLGEFPVADDDTVIPFELVESAARRDVEVQRTAGIVWGVDCARFGNDRSTLAKRRGNKLMEPVRWWRQLDTMQLAGRIKHEYDTTPAGSRPSVICVDVINLGAGVVDRLREWGLPVRGINVSESPALGDKYRNLRAELWFQAKEWFNRRDCSIPNQEELIQELIAPRYKFQEVNGKLIIESKDDLKKRGVLKGDSPDLADAFVLTFAADATVALHGRPRTSWRQPLRRPMKGLV